ncbi:hypothetical protein DY000_02010677 [Brassica cretica]|uniref:Peptidase S9 prolyl oligopeptidase catalytic domain-containing protein n=1 Tax=Brassica cretica TaxID=69181 RepID=A0ABQ7C787_BRACR|nr:hypothetical protein DY000_02010677 [Brassica cretica]
MAVLTSLTRFPSSSSSSNARRLFLSPSSSSSSIKQRFNLFFFKPSRSFASMSSFSSSSSPPLQEKITAPYGSWKSPITADIVSGSSKRLGGTAVDSRGRLVWLESRPNESGRGVLVVEGEKEPIDITPKEFAVRTLTQEYGGGAFRISSSDDDLLVFSNYKDQRLYKQHIDSPPKPITPDYGSPAVTYADGVFDARFHRYITVREDGRQDTSNPITTIVEVNLSAETLEGEEKDFYERSPINFVDRFSCPIILFQGLEDKVVTPDQSRKIYQALKEKGLPVALVEYEGEQHGFRKAENIKYTLEQQMVFFARVVGGFQVADDISPLKIDNFDTSSDA